MLAQSQYAGVLATLIVLGGLTPVQSGQTHSLDELLRQGQEKLTANEWGAAEAAFSQVLRSEPENLQAYEGLGQSPVRGGAVPGSDRGTRQGAGACADQCPGQFQPRLLMQLIPEAT